MNHGEHYWKNIVLPRLAIGAAILVIAALFTFVKWILVYLHH